MLFSHLPWILALIWLVVRWVVGGRLDVDSAQNVGVLTNMLFILMLVFVGINMHYRKLQGKVSGFFEDFKACMKPALLYVLPTLVFIGVYYAYIGDDIQELRIAYIETFEKGIQDEANLNTFLADHPELKGKSKEELMQMNRENVERNVSVKTRLMGGSLALTFIAFGYSLLAVFFWRTFGRK